MAARRPEVRSMSARIAANSRWAREFFPREATAAARRGFYRRFERELDPDGVLAPEERAKRVGNAVSAACRTDRGGHSGVFVDSDGHTWEVLYDPDWILPDGSSSRSDQAERRLLSVVFPTCDAGAHRSVSGATRA